MQFDVGCNFPVIVEINAGDRLVFMILVLFNAFVNKVESVNLKISDDFLTQDIILIQDIIFILPSSQTHLSVLLDQELQSRLLYKLSDDGGFIHL